MSQVKGMRSLAQGFVRKDRQLGKAMEKGLVRAGLQLQRLSQKRVPVDTGDLRNSAFTRKKEGTSGWKTLIQVGYTQSYAIYVHENLEARHAPGKSAKYLEYALRDNKAALLAIVRDEMRKVR